MFEIIQDVLSVLSHILIIIQDSGQTIGKCILVKHGYEVLIIFYERRAYNGQ
jgi:hypothetical protein